MDTLELIRKYYDPGSKAYEVLVHHSRLVAGKAVEIARAVAHLSPDVTFTEEAAMLHDIGIFYADAPKLGCFGRNDYLCHGYLGRELLEREGLPRHALVCERHVGMGITLQEIKDNRLPLPLRDMMPLSIEEKIICFADKFFSKGAHELLHEKTIEEVREMIARYGREKLAIFDELVKLFRV
jgi:uncharacterized protein